MDGSSPLARGLRAADHERPGRGWIIPARAGFTTRRRCGGTRSWDHPRSRGVYAYLIRGLRADDGSSPLARGLLIERVGESVIGRIIPARAGFTGIAAAQTAGHTDHPRSRGVYNRELVDIERR